MYLVASTRPEDFTERDCHPDWPHDRRIEQCVGILQTIFGDSLKHARVLDYGCGRGEWSLAFLRAGARQVVSVDADINKVRHVHNYSRQKRIDGIEVLHGDLLCQNVSTGTADIVWLHDVLHHVSRPLALLQILRDIMTGPTSQMLVRVRDAGSLRQFTIELARLLYARPDRQSFDIDALSLAPAARLGLGDDLLARQVEWFTAAGFAEMLSGAGLEPVARVTALGQASGAEFQPHAALCRHVPAEDAIAWEEPNRDYAQDLIVLKAMAREVDFALSDKAFRRQVALGLLNTHFAHGNGDSTGKDLAVELFLYLWRVLEIHGDVEQMDGLARNFVALAGASTADAPRDHLPAATHPSGLAAYLRENAIRLS